MEQSGRPSWRRLALGRPAGCWGTHNEQGAAAIIARPSQVSPCLPPRLQTSAVRPEGQPGREPRRGSRRGQPGTRPARLPTCLPGAPSVASQSWPQTADPAAPGPGARGAEQPGVWFHPVGVPVTQVEGAHTHAHAGACTRRQRPACMHGHPRTHVPVSAFTTGSGWEGPRWLGASGVATQGRGGGPGAWLGEGLGLPALEGRGPVGGGRLPGAYQGPPQPPTPVGRGCGGGRAHAGCAGWGVPQSGPSSPPAGTVAAVATVALGDFWGASHQREPAAPQPLPPPRTHGRLGRVGPGPAESRQAAPMGLS